MRARAFRDHYGASTCIQSYLLKTISVSFPRRHMPNGRKRKVVEGLDDEKTYRDISIKVKLGRLRPSPDLRAAIEDATGRVHDIVARGLLLANHTLIRELAFGRFPDITKQSWWLNCIKVWGSLDVRKGPPPQIDSRVREAYDTLKDRPGMSQVCPWSASYTPSTRSSRCQRPFGGLLSRRC